MIIAQWTACVMLAVAGLAAMMRSVFESAIWPMGNVWLSRLYFTVSILAIAAAIAVRP